MCKFCDLADGAEKERVVREDDWLIVVMDRHPVTKGHVLVIPRDHVPNFYDLNDLLYSRVMKTVKDISKVLHKVTKSKKVGIIISGWEIPHAHIHIIPMNNRHDITSRVIIENKQLNPSDRELFEMAKKIRKGIGNR